MSANGSLALINGGISADALRGRLDKANFEIAVDKLLKGAGAGADPTEVARLGMAQLPITIATEADIWVNDAERSLLQSLTATKKKETKLNEAIGSTIRIKFDARAGGAYTCHAQIYRNGIALGTYQSLTGESYVTYGEDFDCSAWVANDLLQVYINGETATQDTYVKNFRLCCHPSYNLTNQDPA